jgi:hypothetical protein
MKRLASFVFALGLAAWPLAPSTPEVYAEEKGDTVLFVVMPNKLLDNPHLALKDGKYTEIETIAVVGDAGALDISAIKLEGVTLNTGKYTAEQCKLAGKDTKPIVLEVYFAQKVPEKMKLTNIKYKGEAVATYKLGIGSGKDKPLPIFEATKSK